MGHFWHSFWNKLGAQLQYSSTCHTQTDGQTEVVNRSLSNFMRCLVNDHVKAWDTILPHTEFACNNSVNLTTRKAPFAAAYGHKPQHGLDLMPLPQEARVREDAEAVANHIQRINEEVNDAIKASNELCKDNTDQLGGSKNSLKVIKF